MPHQQRAARTRERIVAAAADEFAAAGYAGARMHAVARAAGVTTGALTFHFPTKAELARAVREAGEAATVAALRADPADLSEVLEQALALAGAMETTPVIRATARLARDGEPGDWYACWLPRLRAGIARWLPADHPPSGPTSEVLAALLGALLLGIEATASTRENLRAVAGCDAREALTRLVSLLET